MWHAPWWHFPHIFPLTFLKFLAFCCITWLNRLLYTRVFLYVVSHDWLVWVIQWVGWLGLRPTAVIFMNMHVIVGRNFSYRIIPQVQDDKIQGLLCANKRQALQQHLKPKSQHLFSWVVRPQAFLTFPPLWIYLHTALAKNTFYISPGHFTS